LIILFSYFQLSLISFLAATILPFSSEVVLTTMYLSNSFEPYFLLIFVSIGNIMGSITNWYLGKKITLFQNRKWFPVSPDQLERSRKYFQKYGLWSLLLAWVPIIGDPLTLLAGVLKVRFSIFFLLVSISKISRYVFLLYLASFVV